MTSDSETGGCSCSQIWFCSTKCVTSRHRIMTLHSLNTYCRHCSGSVGGHWSAGAHPAKSPDWMSELVAAAIIRWEHVETLGRETLGRQGFTSQEYRFDRDLYAAVRRTDWQSRDQGSSRTILSRRMTASMTLARRNTALTRWLCVCNTA